MKKKKVQVSSFRMLCISLAVSIVVLGVGGGFIARASDGGLILKLKAVGEFLRILDKTDVNVLPGKDLGSQEASTDDKQISKFNSIALATDPTTAANSDYQNFIEQYVGLVGSGTTATNTPISVKNTWNQTVYATAWVRTIGAATGTIFAWSGTSTVESELKTTASSTLNNDFGSLFAGRPIYANIDNQIIKSTRTTSTPSEVNVSFIEQGMIPVKAGEYVSVMVRMNDLGTAVGTISQRGASDVMAGIDIYGYSTSTQYY